MAPSLFHSAVKKAGSLLGLSRPPKAAKRKRIKRDPLAESFDHAFWRTFTEARILSGRTVSEMMECKNRIIRRRGEAIFGVFGDYAEEVTSSLSRKNRRKAMELLSAIRHSRA